MRKAEDTILSGMKSRETRFSEWETLGTLDSPSVAGATTPGTTSELAVTAGDIASVQAGMPHSIFQERVIRRILPRQLELLYRIDPLIFASVEHLVESIVTDIQLIDDGTEAGKAELPEWQKFIELIKLKPMLERLSRDSIIVGNGFAEIAYSRDRKEIGLLVGLDPKTMDFQRQGGRIIVDEENQPIGYWQRLTVSGVYAQGKVVKRGQIRIRGGEYVPSPDRAYRLYPVLFDRDQILHIRFYTLGDGLTGISPLESLFNPAVIRLNIESAMGEAIFRSGFPIWVGKVGDKEMRSAPTAVMKALANDLSTIDNKSYFVFPWYISIDTLRPPESKATRDDLLYYKAQIFRAMGVPEELDKESIYFEKKIQALQERLASQVVDQLFTRKAIASDMKSIPIMKFVFQTPGMRMSKARRVAALGRARLLNWDVGLEDAIRREEAYPSSPPGHKPLLPPGKDWYGEGGGGGDSIDRDPLV